MESAEKTGKLMEKLFAVAIEKVETIIDEELQESHLSVAKEVESVFPSAQRKLGLSPSSGVSLLTSVQSGGNFQAR